MEHFDLIVDNLIQEMAKGAISLSDIEKLNAGISQKLGVDSARIIWPDASKGVGHFADFVSNTKRIYIDNQLSEYSSFPELISYWGEGYKSCAIIPIINSGRLICLAEFKSKKENFFSEDMVRMLLNIYYIFCISENIKNAEQKSTRLALYFDAAFRMHVPQLVVKSDGEIVRMNNEASNLMSLNSNILNYLNDISGMDALSKHGAIKAHIKNRSFDIVAERIGEGLYYVFMFESTHSDRLSTILRIMDDNYGGGEIIIGKDFKVKETTASISRLIGYESSLLIGKNILDLISDQVCSFL